MFQTHRYPDIPPPLTRIQWTKNLNHYFSLRVPTVESECYCWERTGVHEPLSPLLLLAVLRAGVKDWCEEIFKTSLKAFIMYFWSESCSCWMLSLILAIYCQSASFIRQKRKREHLISLVHFRVGLGDMTKYIIAIFFTITISITTFIYLRKEMLSTDIFLDLENEHKHVNLFEQWRKLHQIWGIFKFCCKEALKRTIVSIFSSSHIAEKISLKRSTFHFCLRAKY